MTEGNQPTDTERSEAEIQKLLQTWFRQALDGDLADDLLVEVLAGVGDQVAVAGEFPPAAWYKLMFMAMSRILALQLDAGGAMVESATVDEVDDLLGQHRHVAHQLLDCVGALSFQLMQLHSITPSGDGMKVVRTRTVGLYHNVNQYVTVELAGANTSSKLGLDLSRYTAALEGLEKVPRAEDVAR